MILAEARWRWVLGGPFEICHQSDRKSLPLLLTRFTLGVKQGSEGRYSLVLRKCTWVGRLTSIPSKILKELLAPVSRIHW